MTDTDLPVSHILARQVVEITQTEPDAAACHAFARACTDFVTCVLLGAQMPVTEATLRHFAKTDAGQQSTLFGRTERLSPASAAFVNATATHGLDFDDGHTQAGGHPGAAVFPAVFAVAEDIGAGSQDVIRAVIVGYQMMVRVARMMHPKTAQKGWHNTAVAGTFGATGAVASLLKLDVERTAHALGLAGSFTGGILEFLAEGPDVKRIHPGMAARDGITCAGLAQEGVTGPRHVFEGRHGVFNTFIDGKADLSHLHAPGLDIANAYFKLYPCCRHYHAAIDGLLDLRESHGLEMSDVVAVRLGLYANAVRGHDHKTADSLLNAQMSAPIAAALALVDGKVTVSGFQPESLGRQLVQDTLPMIDTSVDPECDRLYPQRRSGVVAVDLKDGRTLENRVQNPRGEGDRPLSDTDLQDKFRTNCEPILGRATSAAVLDLIENLHSVPNGFGQLLAQIGPRHPSRT